MATTINHKFSIPEKFDADYADTFDTFFEQVDRDVAITDTENNVTDYEPKNDAKFLASDTGAVYIGDGSSWNKISSSGDDPTYNSITVLSQLDIPTYSTDGNAPNETTFYHDADNQVKYKDDTGTVIILDGLQSGEDFDGEGTSDFLNIASIDVTDATVSNSPSDPNDVAIKEYVDSVTQGLNWQQPVIAEQNDPPASPSEGDRYLIDDAPTGDWSGHANEITEYINGTWEFFTPDEGWSVFVESSDVLKVFNNSDWVAFGSAIDHGELSGLNDDDHTQYLLIDGTRAMTGGLQIGGDLTANNGETIWDEANTYIPTTRLQNDSVTVAGNIVSLGGSTAINHANLTGIGADDHHAQNHDNADHTTNYKPDSAVTSTSTASGYEITIDGDTYQFNN